MRKRFFIFLIMMLSLSWTVWAGGQAEEIAQEVRADGFKRIGVGDSEVLWKIEGENVVLRFSAPTSGWVSVGFNPTRFMKDANIIIGYVENGEAFVSDQFGTSSISHKADTDLGGSNDILSASGSESAGVTTIETVIPLDSGDQYDQPLAEGDSVTMIFAYGRDGTDNLESKHAFKTTVAVSF